MKQLILDTDLSLLLSFLSLAEGEMADGLGEEMEDDDMANMIDQEIEGDLNPV